MILLSVSHSADVDGGVVRVRVELTEELSLANDDSVSGQRVVWRSGIEGPIGSRQLGALEAHVDWRGHDLS